MADKRRRSGEKSAAVNAGRKKAAGNPRRSRRGEAVPKNSKAGKYADNRKRGKKRKAQGGRSRRKKLPLGKRILVAVCSILLVFVLVVMGAVAYVGSKMDKIDIKKLNPDKLSISDELTYDETGYLNVALFGLDTRATDAEMGSRSDTIIIASLNRETKVIKMASIYRDTLMQLDDGEYYKANSAYSFGKEEEAVAMLNRNLDMNIDHYVTVDFSALVDVIDAVGGIEVDVKPEELEGEMMGETYTLNGYIVEVLENTGKESPGIMEPGLQTLNGVQATAYARIRYTEGGDVKRAERQRLVMTKIAEKLQKGNLLTLNKIIDSVFPKVRTNFTLPEILAYAKDVKKFQFGENLGFPVNTDFTSYKEQGSVVVSSSALADVKELHRYFFGEDGYVPTSTVTAICNDINYINGGTGSTDTYGTDTYSDSGTYTTDNSGYYGGSGYGTGGTDDYGGGTGYAEGTGSGTGYEEGTGGGTGNYGGYETGDDSSGGTGNGYSSGSEY